MKQKKEIFIYVGAPKCGSTFLFTCSKKENIKVALRQQNFSFIDTFEPIFFDMHKRESIRQPCTNILDFKFEEKTFSDEILGNYAIGLVKQIEDSPCQRHIIIQENISLLALIAPSFFKRFIDMIFKPLKTEYIVHAILFIRPQSGLIESLYTQHVRFGLQKTIGQYFSDLVLDRFSWERHSNLFSEISSSGQVKIVPFLPKVMKQELDKNFAEVFFECCGLLTKIGDEQLEKNFNPSCMPELLDLMIYANKTLTRQLANEVNLHLSRNFPRPFEGRKRILCPEAIDELKQSFDKENKAIIRENALWCPYEAFSI